MIGEFLSTSTTRDTEEMWSQGIHESITHQRVSNGAQSEQQCSLLSFHGMRWSVSLWFWERGEVKIVGLSHEENRLNTLCQCASAVERPMTYPWMSWNWESNWTQRLCPMVNEKKCIRGGGSRAVAVCHPQERWMLPTPPAHRAGPRPRMTQTTASQCFTRLPPRRTVETFHHRHPKIIIGL